MTEQKVYTALGLMSGTSLDGIDAAIIKSDGHAIMEFGPFATKPYLPAFRDRLRAVLGARVAPPELVRDLTYLHADLINELLASHGLSGPDIDVIGFHGQTIHHAPEQRFTLQIGDGALLAVLTDCPVVDNFRGRDVAAGGQGAPLAPVYHQALAAKFDAPVVIVNIGGVANVSYVAAGQLLAFDSGPGNAAIDDLMRQRTGAEFDSDGALARQGEINPAVLENLLSHPYFAQQPPKSLDRNGFDYSAVETLTLADAAATLVAFTTETLARSARHFPAPVQRWLVSGGGRHNSFMMQELAQRSQAEVLPVEQVGWNGDALEAQAFAFMAIRARLKLPLSFPATTGVRQELTGGDIHLP